MYPVYRGSAHYDSLGDNGKASSFAARFDSVAVTPLHFNGGDG